MEEEGTEPLTRQGKLHQQPVHGCVVVEFSNQIQQLLLGDGSWPEDGLAADPWNCRSHGVSEAQKGDFAGFRGFKLAWLAAWPKLGGAH